MPSPPLARTLPLIANLNHHLRRAVKINAAVGRGLGRGGGLHAVRGRCFGAGGGRVALNVLGDSKAPGATDLMNSHIKDLSAYSTL